MEETFGEAYSEPAADVPGDATSLEGRVLRSVL
jgi:hypothetical protein